jgi:hypothetical protein
VKEAQDPLFVFELIRNAAEQGGADVPGDKNVRLAP